MVKLGRPIKPKGNTILVEDLLVQYLSTKKDKYDNETCYLKIVDEKLKQKLKPLLSITDESMLIPIWDTNGDYILKAKKKHINNLLVDFETRHMYYLRIEFIHFEFENQEKKLLKGYYTTIPTIRNVEVELEEAVAEK